ncbi:ECF transporter S component [Clostridium sp.]|uniref:ECF transporter S component n=1 Tax=Clostridium sp. TaxID=1506 RepID=UPI00399572BC
MNNSTTKNSLARNLTSAGLLLAIGLILPHFFTAFGREMGTIFSPMDLTVLLGGLILGWRYGLVLGIITPMISTFLTGMPPFPIALTMLFQLGVMGLITGLLRNKINSFFNLIIAEIIGNLLYSCLFVIFMGLPTHKFFHLLFVVFVIGLPGIILQWIIVPYLHRVLKKAGVYNG